MSTWKSRTRAPALSSLGAVDGVEDRRHGPLDPGGGVGEEHRMVQHALAELGQHVLQHGGPRPDQIHPVVPEVAPDQRTGVQRCGVGQCFGVHQLRHAEQCYRLCTLYQGVKAGDAAHNPPRPQSEAAQPQAVGDHEHRRRRHRGTGDHRVQQAQRRQRDGGDVVGEGPEQVHPDGPQCARRQPQRRRHGPQVTAHQGHVAGLDGRIGARPHRHADIGGRQGNRVVDAVPDHRHPTALAPEVVGPRRLSPSAAHRRSPQRARYRPRRPRGAPPRHCRR